MSTLKELVESKRGLEVTSVSELASLYDETIDQLRLCAKVEPSSNVHDRKTDEMETALLDFEANLLDQAARIQIRNKGDLDKLMDIWAKASGVDTGRRANPSDRIAMNVFRYLSDINLGKG